MEQGLAQSIAVGYTGEMKINFYRTGYRTLGELRYAFADCWIDTDDARVVLEAMFPKQSSDVWPVD